MKIPRDSHDYGCEVPPCSRHDLLLNAHEIQTSFEYKGTGPFPIMELVELVFPHIYQKQNYTFDVVSAEILGEKFGQTFPDKHLIMIREDIYDLACAGDGFARQTVAHEACHQILHEGVPLSMARRDASKDLPAYRSSEWQANAMAGALLMPACKIIHMNYKEIADVYKVTITAAMTQKNAIEKEARRWPIPML